MYAQDLQLNEVMTKNKSYLNLNDEYHDWVELYNSSAAPILLSEYYISDDENNLFKYQLPAVFINGNSHFSVICSALNQFISGYYHSNFALKNSEVICLSNNQGLIEKWELDFIPANLSYGRINENEDVKEILQFPSPNMFNLNSNNNKVETNTTSGFYENDFFLKLESKLGDSVFYTLNNYDPLSGPILFKDSLLVPIDLSIVPDISTIPTTSNQQISYHAWELPQETPQKCFSISYASYKNGVRTSPIYHQTFIPENNETNFDVVSITSDSIGLFSTSTGILVPGVNYNSSNPEWTGNFFKEGENWERKAHFTYFKSDQNASFYQPIHIKIAGGKTRQSAQKSLALQATSELANKNLIFPVFQTTKNPFINAYTLKTTMGDWGTQSMLKDVLAHTISKELHFNSQDYKFVEVYINGVYFGIQSLRERFSPRNFLQNSISDELTILNPSNLNVNYGNKLEFESLLSFIESDDLSVTSNYLLVSEQIDIDNLIDYLCAELFFGNYDWPINNIKAVKVSDSKWQWLFYDLDAAFPPPQTNMFEHVTNKDESTSYPNPPASTLLFRKLLENVTFKSLFILRYTELLHSTFTKENTTNVLTALENELAPVISKQINRWGFPYSEEKWESDIASLQSFLVQRPCAVINNMNAFFDSDYLQTACDVKWNEVENFKIYPNPTSDFIHVISKNQQLKINRLEFYNSLGQRVKGQTPLKQSFHYFASIQSLNAGVYTLVLYTNNGEIKHKIIKY